MSTRAPPEVLQRLQQHNISIKILPEKECNQWRAKISRIHSLGPHLREDIADAMCFAIDHCTYSFHLIEILVAAIDPVKRATEIREVIWKIHTATDSPQQDADMGGAIIQAAKAQVKAACGKLLARLFLVSDIFMNSLSTAGVTMMNPSSLSSSVKDGAQRRSRNQDDDDDVADDENSREDRGAAPSPTQRNNLGRPSDLAAVIQIFLDIKIVQQLAEFVVMSKRKEIQKQMKIDSAERKAQDQQQQQQQQQQPNIVTLHLNDIDDPVCEVVGWIREMWSFWKVNQNFSLSSGSSSGPNVNVVQRLEDKFGFLLVTPKGVGRFE